MLGGSDDDLGVLSLAVVAALVAVHLVVLLRSGEAAGHRPGALVLQEQRALGHPEVAHLAPVLAPAVPRLCFGTLPLLLPLLLFMTASTSSLAWGPTKKEDSTKTRITKTENSCAEARPRLLTIQYMPSLGSVPQPTTDTTWSTASPSGLMMPDS